MPRSVKTLVNASVLGAGLGALFGLAEAVALVWLETVAFTTPRATLGFVLVAAGIYSVFGLALAVAALLWAAWRRRSPHRRPHPAAAASLIPTLFAFYAVCCIGHYYLLFPIRSLAFLMTLGTAAILSLAVGWALRQVGRRMVPLPRPLRFLRPSSLPALLAAVLLAAAAGWVAAATPSRPASAPGPANVVLITLDTLRADHIGAYGAAAAETPHLDRLAQSGALFRSAYTPVVLTGPAHAALLTSRYPADHRLLNNGDRIGAHVATLAEILQKTGYSTFGAVSVVHLDGHYSGLDRGFQRFENSGRLSPWMPLSLLRIANTSLTRLDLPSFWTPFRSGARVVDDFEGWLDVHHRERFVAWLHLYDAHFPYGGPEADASRPQELLASILEQGAGIDDPRVGQLAGLYRQGVRSADAQVGRVLAALSRFGLLSDTLVIVASDHGETLANPSVERTFWFHHADVYEDTARVALLMSYPPAIRPGTVIDSPVSLLDVTPTALSLLGRGAGAARFRGIDLVPLLAGHTGGRSEECLIVQHAPNHTNLDSWAVRRACWKLVLRSSRNTVELYDICHDPGERVDLAPQRPEAVAELRACFNAYRRFYRAPAERPPLPLWLTDNLRSLGYL